MEFRDSSGTSPERGGTGCPPPERDPRPTIRKRGLGQEDDEAVGAAIDVPVTWPTPENAS